MTKARPLLARPPLPRPRPRRRRQPQPIPFPVWAPAVPAHRRRRAPGDGAADRLLDRGARALSNEELLGLVLGVESAAARRVLERAGGVAKLCQTPPGQAAQWPGLSRSRLVRLFAALELGRRGVFPCDGKVPCFRSPNEVARYLLARYGNSEVEEFGVLLLDTRGCLRRAEIVSRGSLTGALVHPRELFRVAVSYQAASVVLFHNHPSGNPLPSAADRQLTRRLQEAGATVGVPVLDHVVIGAGRWYSFGEAGDL